MFITSLLTFINGLNCLKLNLLTLLVKGRLYPYEVTVVIIVNVTTMGITLYEVSLSTNIW